MIIYIILHLHLTAVVSVLAVSLNNMTLAEDGRYNTSVAEKCLLSIFPFAYCLPLLARHG